MKQLFQRLRAAFAGLAPRERILVSTVLGLVAFAILWFAGVDDQRGCLDDCSCGDIDVQCNPLMESNGGHSCNESPPYPLPEAPACSPGFFDSAKLISMMPTGTCAPGSATATGELVAVDATTVCCHP